MQQFDLVISRIAEANGPWRVIWLFSPGVDQANGAALGFGKDVVEAKITVDALKLA